MSVKVIKTKVMKPIFERTNLRLEVDYDYERSECTCDAYERGDYCRCTTIDHAWVETVNVKQVIDELYARHHQTDSEINKYCFDRICIAFKVYDKDYYEVESCPGYYGEEIGGVYFENEEKVVEAYNEVLKFYSNIEKIKYVLELEYGYLLDRITCMKSAFIEKVSTEKIKLPQKEYFVRLSKEVVEDYKDRKLPVAVCIKEKDRFHDVFDTYTLVDGYHRFIANKDSATNRIIVLE
jgi:hypothetical protein